MSGGREFGGSGGRAVKLRLTWIEVDQHERILSQREEILEGESQRSVTKGNARKLISRTYPDKRVSMIDASRPPHKWCAVIEMVTPNRWLYIYADPLDSGD